MSPTKQRLLGGIILMIGGALLAVLLLGRQHSPHLKNDINKESASEPVKKIEIPVKTANDEVTQQEIDSRPLTLDIETERKMLEEAKNNRLKQVEEQEQKAAELLQAQQQAESDAAKKARLEQEHLRQRAELKEQKANLKAEEEAQKTAQTVKKESESVKKDAEKVAGVTVKKEKELDKKVTTAASLEKAEEVKKNNDATKNELAKKQEQQKANNLQTQLKEKARQDELKRLKQEKEAQEKLAKEIAQKKDEEIKKLKAEKALLLAAQKEKAAQVKEKVAASTKSLTSPSIQVKKDTHDQNDAEDNHALENNKTAKQKLDEARQQAKDSKDQGNWVVQVAIAQDQASADSMVARLRAKGYQVKTSPTTKGVRVMVGPEKGREPALLVKRQIDSDPSLGVNGAWIMNWQPASH